MGKKKTQSYTEVEVLNEIAKLKAQTDMMENLLYMYEEQYYEAQRNFGISITNGQNYVNPVSHRGQAVSFVYHMLKKVMDRCGITPLLKRTKFFQKNRIKETIYKISHGII